MADLARQMGERIRAARKLRRWTQEELAARSGLHYTHIGAVERGEKYLTAKSLQRIAQALGMPMGELLEPVGGAREPRAVYVQSTPCEFEVLLQKYPPAVKRRALELLRLALRLR